MTASANRTASARNLLLVLASLLMSVFFLLVIGAAIGSVGWIVLGVLDLVADPDERFPRLSAWVIVAIPVVAVTLAFVLSRGGDGRTFYAQQRANRGISLLLLVTMVGILAVLGEAIAASLTFNSIAALAGAGLAGVGGLGAAAYAHLRGANAVLDAARARPADPQRDRVLLDVVAEISLAANIQPPRTYVIEDGTMNAMAVGTRRDNASIAVTRGLLNAMDREQLQGVVAHEIAHIRNLDSRYGVYVAIMVGLIALVTDGFLRIVLRAWQEGAFLRGAEGADDAKAAAAGLAAGVAFGVLLLVAASFLRIFAPLASVLVQAAVSRQREFLADATSVELTRNPTGLARALAELRVERDPLDYPNRGSQHLWFSTPFGTAEPRWNLLATHPSLDNRIDRLAVLYPARHPGGSAATSEAGAG